MDDLDKSLLEILENPNLELHNFYGDVMDKWFQNKAAGPLLLFIFANLLNPDFKTELYDRYDGITIFSLYLAESGESSASYLILFSHSNFELIGLFGQILTPAEFAEQLKIAKETADEVRRVT